MRTIEDFASNTKEIIDLGYQISQEEAKDHNEFDIDRHFSLSLRKALLEEGVEPEFIDALKEIESNRCDEEDCDIS